MTPTDEHRKQAEKDIKAEYFVDYPDFIDGGQVWSDVCMQWDISKLIAERATVLALREEVERLKKNSYPHMCAMGGTVLLRADLS